MEYKRLTKRVADYVFDNCCNCEYDSNPQGCTDHCCYEVMKNRLAELEDKIEQGTLIELPCKVGTDIYYVGKYQIGTWKKRQQFGIFHFPFTLDMLDTYGTNWFLTREEAERALKERE